MVKAKNTNGMSIGAYSFCLVPSFGVMTMERSGLLVITFSKSEHRLVDPAKGYVDKVKYNQSIF
jgi:hypothetical protein